MLTLRPQQERGTSKSDWLDSRHTFSFDQYYDAKHESFRALRVINEDRIAPNRGFGTHPHRDMEIVTYVISGVLQHRDSLGHGSMIRPGEIQRMSAGTGIRHSEANPSASEPVHLLQIWLLPERRDLEPGYEQKTFVMTPGQLTLIGSRAGGADGVVIHQDVQLHAGKIRPQDELIYPLAPGRYAWLQVVRGGLRVNGELASAGDGVALSNEAEVVMQGYEEAEVLLFDLA